VDLNKMELPHFEQNPYFDFLEDDAQVSTPLPFSREN
jgi:hypothetical protein